MKNYALKLVVPIIALALVYSCSKDRLNEVEQNRELAHKSATTDYLDDFYGGVAYTLGDAIETTDEASRTFEVFPVTLSGDSDSRGYLAMDTASGELIYFVDVDRVNYVMTSEDIQQAVTAQYEDINEYEQWEDTDELDFMMIINDHNGDPNPPQSKFWGKDKYNVGPCIGHKQLTTTDFYVFWIRVSSTNESEYC